MVFNEYRSRSDRLENIIRYVIEFVLNKSVIQLNRKTVFYLIKLYTDRINIAMNEQLMVGTKIDKINHMYNIYLPMGVSFP